VHAIKILLEKYKAFIWSILQPLGPWAVFGIAAADSAAFGLPLDPVIATYVWNMRKWLLQQDTSIFSIKGIFFLFLMYPLMAGVGSALGSLVVYAIGRKGGEVALAKRVSRAKLDHLRQTFEKREFMALMIPSMLPPPTPFKLFVLSAGVFQMKVRDFMLAIFLGRVLRFFVLSVLVVAFGPAIVEKTKLLFVHHPALAVALVLAVILGVVLLVRAWREPVEELAHELEEREEVAQAK
jgi:membrane protein YqaA with SNARE-associated domain